MILKIPFTFVTYGICSILTRKTSCLMILSVSARGVLFKIYLHTEWGFTLGFVVVTSVELASRREPIYCCPISLVVDETGFELSSSCMMMPHRGWSWLMCWQFWHNNPPPTSLSPQLLLWQNLRKSQWTYWIYSSFFKRTFLSSSLVIVWIHQRLSIVYYTALVCDRLMFMNCWWTVNEHVFVN